jgi:DNA-binding response OmpR family regulator
MLSARGEDRDRERALAVGAAGFMTKPYSPHELKRLVRELVGGD